jgi:hypothetical protein
MNLKTIGGIVFEAVRYDHPRPHWRARCVATRYVFQAGVFKSASRPQMWASIQDIARRLGPERFTRETLSAKEGL